MLVAPEGISATVVKFGTQVHLQPQNLIYTSTELYEIGICWYDSFCAEVNLSRGLLPKVNSQFCTDLANHVSPMFCNEEYFQTCLFPKEQGNVIFKENTIFLQAAEERMLLPAS